MDWDGSVVLGLGLEVRHTTHMNAWCCPVQVDVLRLELEQLTLPHACVGSDNDDV